MDIKLKYKQVFSDLYQSENGLLAYTFYSRYSLMPSEAIDFIDTYQNEGYISIDDELRIKLTNKGRDSIESIQKRLQSAVTDNVSPFLREFVLIESEIEIFTPYIPNINFYNKYVEERREKEVRE